MESILLNKTASIRIFGEPVGFYSGNRFWSYSNLIR